MARARPVADLTAESTFGDAAAAAIETRSQEVFTYAARVQDRGNPEDVHDMRVATRRLRAALEIFAECFPRKRHRQVLKDVKRLADALGARRDPDVAAERLRELEAAFHDADRAGLRSLLATVEGERAEGNAEIARALTDALESGLEERLAELAAEARR
jgi:CHAD domain-containing protein